MAFIELSIHQTILKKIMFPTKMFWINVSWSSFLKDHVTLKTGLMMMKIQLWSQEKY